MREPAGDALRSMLEAAAEGLGGVERVAAAQAVELRHAGRSFARLAEDAASFRLDPSIAAAALRTPDTSASPLGPEWVEFRPTELDRFALDRAMAWLESAWRLAGPAART